MSLNPIVSFSSSCISSKEIKEEAGYSESLGAMEASEKSEGYVFFETRPSTTSEKAKTVVSYTLPNVSLTPDEREDLREITRLLTAHLGYNLKESVAYALQIILHPGVQQKRVDKKQGVTPRTLMLLESTAYIHEKKPISEGHIKLSYRASSFNRDKGKAKKVVHLKVKNAASLNMVESESVLQKSFIHPHIVKIYDIVKYPSKKDSSIEKIALYAEFCHFSLQNLIEFHSLSFKEKVDLSIHICSALIFLHSHGYSHNDIKPDNILVKKKKGKLIGKLTDFGLTNLFGSQISNGFIKIQAPEQRISDPKIYSAETDVYQFGLTLWHFFHPNPPVGHLDAHYQYPMKNLFSSWPPLNNLDLVMHQLILRSLKPNPSERLKMSSLHSLLQAMAQKLS